MIINRAYRSEYNRNASVLVVEYCEYKQSWSEKQEQGYFAMRIFGKRKPGKSKQAQIL